MTPHIKNQKLKILALHLQRGVRDRDSFWLTILILFIAAIFRFVAIDSAPPGWRDDELIEFGMDQRIAQGWRPLFIAEAEGHEPVYHYLHAETITLFGENIVGYKWLPFAFGLLTVVLTYALAKRLFGVRVGLIAAALMAVTFWPIMYSRLGVRHIGLLPWMLGAFYMLYPAAGALRESPRRRIIRVIVAGICLAAGLMTYFAGRAVPIILIGFLIYLLIFNRSILRSVWLSFAAAIAIGALLALPMFIQIAQTPGGEKRTEVVGGPLIELTKGNLKSAFDTTLGTLGMFTIAGDPESLYNVSGRPVFDWVTGLFFYLGILISLLRLKRVEHGFALAWLVIGIAPAFVSLPAGSFSHTIAALPIVFVLVGVGVTEVVSVAGRLIARRREGRLAGSSLLRYLAIALSMTLVGIGSWLTLRDYFGTWAHDDFVRFQYHAPTRDIAQWLDQNPDVVDVAIGTNPNELYLDPVALKLDLIRDDVNVRWFNAESALVFTGAKPVILLTAMQRPSEEVQHILSAQAQYDHRSDPFDIYTLLPVIGAQYPPGGSFDNSRFIFMGGTSALTDQSLPGQQIGWNTFWRIRETMSISRLKMFLHVLDHNDLVVAGDDQEDVNFATLKPGDEFAQISQLTLPGNLTPGKYQVEVGWYNPETGERLKLNDGSDRFLLDPIEVKSP